MTFPDRHSMSEMHLSVDDDTGAVITAGYAPLADGFGGVEWTDPAAGVAGSGMVPYFLASGQTFTVPVYKQALFEMTIDNEGILEVDGFLVEVH